MTLALEMVNSHVASSSSLSQMVRNFKPTHKRESNVQNGPKRPRIKIPNVIDNIPIELFSSMILELFPQIVFRAQIEPFK